MPTETTPTEAATEAACRVCGWRACPPPRAWVAPGLCSLCALAAEALLEWIRGTRHPDPRRLWQEVQRNLYIDSLPDDNPAEPGFTMGKCCTCEQGGPLVRNIVMLPVESPEPGIGCWGCVQCGLPSAGAVAVLCDACAEHPDPRWAVLGAPAQNRRIPIEQLTKPFLHDLSKHEEED